MGLLLPLGAQRCDRATVIFTELSGFAFCDYLRKLGRERGGKDAEVRLEGKLATGEFDGKFQIDVRSRAYELVFEVK